MMKKPTQLEIEERERVFQPKIAYSNPVVHVGFWFDEQAIQDDNMRVVAHKRDKCQLLVQKTRRMYRNVLKATTLALKTPFVIFGEKYQFTSCFVRDFLNRRMYLAATINEKEIDKVLHFQHGCRVTATSMKDTCVRNTFMIKGTSTNRDGQQVLLGEDVLIQISESSGLPLYVQCENSTVSTFGLHLVCNLSQDPDMYCRFKFLHGDPALRYKTVGTPFSSDTMLIIQHSASGQNMALENKRLLATLFGSEIEVTCHTFRDYHKVDGQENYWKIVTRFISNNALYIKAAKGEELTPDELEQI